MSERRYLNELTSTQRKEHPMCTGLIDYFPDALALISHVSWRGNEKHNPGEPLHHARGKSMDHSDCHMRHMSTRYCIERDGVISTTPPHPLLHMAEAVWRGLAELQSEMELLHGLDTPAGAKDCKSDDRMDCDAAVGESGADSAVCPPHLWVYGARGTHCAACGFDPSE